MSVDTLLDRLEGVRPNGRDRWMAKCPAHDDRSPSLSIRETGDGTILLHCFAQCPATDVVAAVGLELQDLFPDGPVAHHVQGRRPRRRNLREVLDAVSQALSVLTLADAKCCGFFMLDDDESAAVDHAVQVIRKFQTEARSWR